MAKVVFKFNRKSQKVCPIRIGPMSIIPRQEIPNISSALGNI
jgi:hypothetical protein